jgi:ubiquinone/menaquinone biosynthesis C-methylase UbiE
MTSKKYGSYEEYVIHQKAKLKTLKPEWLEHHDSVYRKELSGRIASMDLKGRSVLCLGARTGGEVRAFAEAGAFAVGIDLEPGKNNPWVLPGDFHNIQFPNNSVQIVFTNSLDHALVFEKVVGEIYRVLKPLGIFICEIVKGTAEGVEAKEYETTVWDTADEVIPYFTEKRFRIIYKKEFTLPWPGKHVVFERGI